MKKIFSIIILGIFLMSFASAAISLETEPKNLYNLNDKIEVDVKINPAPQINDLVILSLVCPETTTEIYKEFLYTSETTTKKLIIPLVKEFIGDSTGDCEIEAKIGDKKEIISNTFEISDRLDITVNLNGEQIRPGKIVTIDGSAIRKNSKPALGTIEAKIDGEILTNGQIKDGVFSLEFPLHDNFKAGEHTLTLTAYEKNKQGQITNHGEKKVSIMIMQVPTNLEIFLDKKEIMPGTAITGEILLRDQTGQKMNSKAYLAVKNQDDEIIEKIELKTEEEFSYPIKYNELPNKWSLAVYADELINRVDVKILENEDVSVNLINKTLIIENKGNVRYNKTVSVNIGDEIVDVPVFLNVGEQVKYSVSAPSGEYKIKVGEMERTVSLTGNAINIERISEGGWGAVKIIAWVFMICILGLTAFTIFRKGYNKTFFGRITGRKAKKPMELQSLPEDEKLADSKMKGELTLSITGSKQNTPIGCVFIKNYEEIKSGVGGTRETLNQISNIIEHKKGIIYENKGNFFFLIPPIRTKTFKNEKPLLESAIEIKKILDEHNKKFKIKINYGLGLNFGTIVSKEEGNKFQFMSMGTLMTTTKKLSNRSTGEILIGDKLKERFDKEVVLNKVEIEGLEAYEFKEIKEVVDNSKFINNFVKKNF